MITVVALAGCQPKTEVAEQATEQTAAPRVSNVPLRIWVAGQLAEPEQLERRWLSDSSQPVEIRPVEIDALLGDESLECDVILFPSRHLGELVHRGRVSKLPNALDTTNSEPGVDAEEERSSIAEGAQVSLSGTNYALSLGCSIPVVIASDSLQPLADSSRDWGAIVAALPEATAPDKVSESQIDSSAVVDRFLAISGSFAQRNPLYGILFQMQQMAPRLTEPEFIEAANILKRLYRQPGGARSVLGTHSDAWTWAAGNPEAAIAIAAPTLLDAEAAAIDSGCVLRVTHAASDPSWKSGGWNTGGGLLAALSSNCRQTAQATEFLQWIATGQTRSVLESILPGVSTRDNKGAATLRWQALQQSREAEADLSLPQELRLPGASSLRQVLGIQLVKMLREDLSPEETLQEVSAQWQDWINASNQDMREAYEQSLGLGY